MVMIELTLHPALEGKIAVITGGSKLYYAGLWR